MPQPSAFCPNIAASPDGDQVWFTLKDIGKTVVLYDQGITQIVQATFTGLEPKHPFSLALAPHADGSGPVELLASFVGNPAGAANVNAVGPIRQLTHNEAGARRYLVVVGAATSAPILVQP